MAAWRSGAWRRSRRRERATSPSWRIPGTRRFLGLDPRLRGHRRQETLRRPGQARAAVPALVRVDDPYASFLFVLAGVQSPPASASSRHSSDGGDRPVARSSGQRCAHRRACGDRRSLPDRRRRHDRATMWSRQTTWRSAPALLLYPNVTVREGCRIGARVIVQPGRGHRQRRVRVRPAARRDRTRRSRSSGIVVIEDDVEIGANCHHRPRHAWARPGSARGRSSTT